MQQGWCPGNDSPQGASWLQRGSLQCQACTCQQVLWWQTGFAQQSLLMWWWPLLSSYFYRCLLSTYTAEGHAQTDEHQIGRRSQCYVNIETLVTVTANKIIPSVAPPLLTNMTFQWMYCNIIVFLAKARRLWLCVTFYLRVCNCIDWSCGRSMKCIMHFALSMSLAQVAEA